MYRNLEFTDGLFRAVWVETADGVKIASFPCDYKNWEEAKRFAKILAEALITYNPRINDSVKLLRRALYR